MTEAEAIRLFKCLSDKSRLQILKSLAIEDMYVERLAERLGITAPTVSFHLKKLADAGAVTSYKSQYYMMYSLKKDIFETRILEILQEESDEAEVQAQRDAEYRRKVIDTFFENGRLKAIPNTVLYIYKYSSFLTQAHPLTISPETPSRSMGF